MTISIPAVIVIVVIVLLIVALVGRQERPPLTPTRSFQIAAAVCFALATVGMTFAGLALVPLGLFLYVCGYLVSPR